MTTTVQDVALTGLGYAEVNWGRWIVRCPRPHCWNAVALPVDTALAACVGDGGCGLEFPVLWPPDPIAIAALLVMRPVPATRNWLPGETVEDLAAENAAHDCLPLDWLHSGRLVLARTRNQVVVDGVLAEALPTGRVLHKLEGR